MKRKWNIERITILFMFIVMVLGFGIQQKQISDMSNLIKKVDIPIEKKEGYWVELSEIPQELLEREVIHE